jgi:hypothetical protein
VELAWRGSGRPPWGGNAFGSRQREHLVKLAVEKFHGDLDAANPVFAREVNGPLRMLEIVSLRRMGRPIAQAPQIKLRPRMLKQDFHRL